MAKQAKNPDLVAEKFAESGSKLTVKNLNREYVMIEGDRRALRFLARIIEAQADFGDEDCAFQFSPKSAGKALFTKDSTRGLVIHVRHEEPMKPPKKVRHRAAAAQGRKRARPAPEPVK
jgi:hypothetical protein